MSGPGDQACEFVNILNDDYIEPIETFLVSATVTGGTIQDTINILDNDSKF